MFGVIAGACLIAAWAFGPMATVFGVGFLCGMVFLMVVG